MNIRIGNDIPLVWRFYTYQDGQKIALNMEGRDLTVYLIDSAGQKTAFPIDIHGNALSLCFYGKQQRRTGNYTLTLVENAGRIGMRTIDKVHPFCLVPYQETVAGGIVEGSVSELEVQPLNLDSNLGSAAPYLSMERLRPYLYRVTFDSLQPDDGADTLVSCACSSFVQNGKLYRNLDFNYDEAASFIVRCRDFEGMSFITGLNDGNVAVPLAGQLPYRVVDGRNRYGIMVSTHVLFNDWQWHGSGDRSVPLTRLPFHVLSRVRSMATLADDLAGIIDNLTSTAGLDATGYLLQLLVTDGSTTYAIMPPLADGQQYVLQDISSNPKMANFRWVESAAVTRDMLQARPTGVERWNLMPCSLQDLRFTAAYENPDRLSEFIGIYGTTKDSSDSELEAIYNVARAKYLERTRNGETWHTMHSVVYGSRMENLYVQEDWSDNII